MAGPVTMKTAEDIAAKIEEAGLIVSHVGIFAVGTDGAVKLTINGLPEKWAPILSALEKPTTATATPVPASDHVDIVEKVRQSVEAVKAADQTTPMGSCWAPAEKWQNGVEQTLEDICNALAVITYHGGR